MTTGASASKTRQFRPWSPTLILILVAVAAAATPMLADGLAERYHQDDWQPDRPVLWLLAEARPCFQ